MLDFLVDIPIVFIVAFLAIAAICVGAFLQSKDKKTDDIVTSKDLHEQMNRENAKDGKTTIPAINATMGTSSNNLARRDKSWSSLPDFFIQLVKGRRD